MKHILRFALVFIALASCPVHLRSGALGTGSQTCPTSGRKALSTTSVKAIYIDLQGTPTNMGSIYIGGPAVTTSAGVFITASGTYRLGPASNTASEDLSQTFIACTNSADSLTFTYQQ